MLHVDILVENLDTWKYKNKGTVMEQNDLNLPKTKSNYNIW